MMADYIRREDALKLLSDDIPICGASLYQAGAKGGLQIAHGIVAAIPAADVVPVVRCKDCEFSRELTKTEKKIWRDECRACESPEASQDGYMIVFPEHFCSYGRRKEQCD